MKSIDFSYSVFFIIIIVIIIIFNGGNPQVTNPQLLSLLSKPHYGGILTGGNMPGMMIMIKSISSYPDRPLLGVDEPGREGETQDK